VLCFYFKCVKKKDWFPHWSNAVTHIVLDNTPTIFFRVVWADPASGVNTICVRLIIPELGKFFFFFASTATVKPHGSYSLFSDGFKTGVVSEIVFIALQRFHSLCW
jgi:hypothetical protein